VTQVLAVAASVAVLLGLMWLIERWMATRRRRRAVDKRAQIALEARAIQRRINARNAAVLKLAVEDQLRRQMQQYDRLPRRRP
jgi:hypothetical protein